MNKTGLFLSLAFFAAAPPSTAETAHSSGKGRTQVKNTEITQRHTKQTDGKPLADGFGSLSHQDARVREILSLVAPDADVEKLNMMSLRPWKNGLQVALVCLNKHPLGDFYRENPNHYAQCGPDSGNPVAQMTLAVLTKDANGKFALAAKPYTERYDYEEKDEFYPSPKPAMEGKRQFVVQIPDGGLQIGLPARLDFAAYRLNDKTDAFGLRLQNTVGYAGGGSLEEFMVLFAVIEGRLKPVLNANTFTLENIAGSWNKDGTRQHDVYTDTYILKMSPQQHHGFYDIIWQAKGMKNGERKIYRWDAEKQEYGSLE